MPNIHTQTVNSGLIRAKLEKLLQDVQEAYQAGDIQTVEALVSQANSALSLLFSRLNKPIFSPLRVLPDLPPDVDSYNQWFTEISKDLRILFTEFETLEDFMMAGFNFATSEATRVNRKLKEAASKLANFILYSRNASSDAIFFTNSFNDVLQIDVASSLLTVPLCEVNDAEGIVTLPIDRAAQKRLTFPITPVINATSNGTVGNNQEIGASQHGDIRVILDDNPDTWFEYEKVTTAESDTADPLILDFTIPLGTESIINFIRVNPNNFGTRTGIEIEDIQTSLDGITYTSIKDEIPIPGVTLEDEENIFLLAPSTSKFAGQGLFTFLPRKVRYIHFVFKQEAPYVINTPAGERLRYAIGLRDVSIEQLPYQSQGELISTPYTTASEVRKVLLSTSQIPLTDSSLMKIEHFLSADDGNTWLQIRPKESVGTSAVLSEIPELLDFNGVDQNTVVTQTPVTSLRYRALLSRVTEAFTSGGSALQGEKQTVTELLRAPLETSIELPLKNTPLDGTLEVLDPRFGSRRKGLRYRILAQDSNFNTAAGTLTFDLPFPIPIELTKTGSPPTLSVAENVRVFINGTELSRASFTLNRPLGRLTIPASGGEAVSGVIEVELTEERLGLSSAVDPVAQLAFHTVRDKKEIELYSIETNVRGVETLRRGARVHHLAQKNLVAGSVTFSGAVSVFASPQSFVDGTTELSASPAGQYSIDLENGVIYSFSPSSSSALTGVSYLYNKYTRLSDNEWDFTDPNGRDTRRLLFYRPTLRKLASDVENVPTSTQHFNLGNLSVEPGSVSFYGDSAGAFVNEVVFIDGQQEFQSIVQAVQDVGSLAGSGNVAFSFSERISLDTNLPVIFSNSTVFANLVASEGAIQGAGDYYVDRINNRVVVNIAAAVSDAGRVTFYYNSPVSNPGGLFSINYTTGEVSTYTATGSGTTVDYNYTNYVARYPIARKLDADEYSFNSADNILTIKDREILRRINLASAGSAGIGSAEQLYRIAYDAILAVRVRIDELEPYFSPVLKDYTLKVITKDKLLLGL